jgi:hypothetical protein
MSSFNEALYEYGEEEVQEFNQGVGLNEELVDEGEIDPIA